MIALSWELFGDAILTGVLLSALLPLLGAILVLRHQIFLAAAIAQSGNLGIAVGIALGLGGHAHGSDVHGHATETVLGLLFAAATGALAMRALTAAASSLEARAVWTFLFASSAALLLLNDAPHGRQEIQRLMLSSLLGASRADVAIAAALLALSVAAFGWRRRALLLWATDPESAAAYGHRTAVWDLVVGGWIGIAIGFAIHSSGLPFAFGGAVLPVLFARAVTRTLRGTLLVAPLFGAASFGVAFVAGDRLDLPPGQCTVALQAIAAAAARLRPPSRRT
ncbi:MAG: metal ABC transporter permease [Planctomycetes bacterium]|nr:metal ABC transporter permease [Planctomycetota bacterium]